MDSSSGPEEGKGEDSRESLLRQLHALAAEAETATAKLASPNGPETETEEADEADAGSVVSPGAPAPPTPGRPATSRSEASAASGTGSEFSHRLDEVAVEQQRMRGELEAYVGGLTSARTGDGSALVAFPEDHSSRLEAEVEATRQRRLVGGFARVLESVRLPDDEEARSRWQEGMAAMVELASQLEGVEARAREAARGARDTEPPAALGQRGNARLQARSDAAQAAGRPPLPALARRRAARRQQQQQQQQQSTSRGEGKHGDGDAERGAASAAAAAQRVRAQQGAAGQRGPPTPNSERGSRSGDSVMAPFLTAVGGRGRSTRGSVDGRSTVSGGGSRQMESGRDASVMMRVQALTRDEEERLRALMREVVPGFEKEFDASLWETEEGEEGAAEGEGKGAEGKDGEEGQGGEPSAEAKGSDGDGGDGGDGMDLHVPSEEEIAAEEQRRRRLLQRLEAAQAEAEGRDEAAMEVRIRAETRCSPGEGYTPDEAQGSTVRGLDALLRDLMPVDAWEAASATGSGSAFPDRSTLGGGDTASIVSGASGVSKAQRERATVLRGGSVVTEGGRRDYLREQRFERDEAEHAREIDRRLARIQARTGPVRAVSAGAYKALLSVGATPGATVDADDYDDDDDEQQDGGGDEDGAARSRGGLRLRASTARLLEREAGLFGEEDEDEDGDEEDGEGLVAPAGSVASPYSAHSSASAWLRRRVGAEELEAVVAEGKEAVGEIAPADDIQKLLADLRADQELAARTPIQSRGRGTSRPSFRAALEAPLVIREEADEDEDEEEETDDDDGDNDNAVPRRAVSRGQERAWSPIAAGRGLTSLSDDKGGAVPRPLQQQRDSPRSASGAAPRPPSERGSDDVALEWEGGGTRPRSHQSDASRPSSVRRRYENAQALDAQISAMEAEQRAQGEE